jgi:dCTP deaminase
LILSDSDIIREIEDGRIVCYPFDRNNLSNSSLDLRLGRYIHKQSSLLQQPIKFDCDPSGKLTVINTTVPSERDLLDPRSPNGKSNYILRPGAFVLAQTLELVGHPGDQIVSQVLDKSTLARLGLSVCFSAGYIDAGNVLSITLELKNNGNAPIELQYGMHICQLRFQYLSSPVSAKYSGKYQNSLNPEVAK